MIADVSREDQELRQAVVGVLGTEARSRDTIVDELAQRGIELGAGPATGRKQLDRLLQFDTTFSEVAAGVIHVPSVLEGTSWTVSVDAGDARDGFVRTQPFLTPLSWWLVGDDVSLVDDAGNVIGPLETDGLMLDGRDTDVVFGPGGWLDNLAGGWATVTVTDGALRWSRCDAPPEPTDAQIAAVRAGFDQAATTETVEMYEDDGPVGLRFATADNPIHEALVIDRTAFIDGPIPPLPELYRAAGLLEWNEIIAEEDFDWKALRSWQERNRFKRVYELGDQQAEGLTLLLGACWAVLAGDPDALGPDDDQRDKATILLAGLLEEGAVAEAFWHESMTGDDPISETARFVDALAARFDGFLPAGLAWLRARCLDRSGDTAAAIATLEEAVTADCDHHPALLELAGFAADRGDAGEAYRLLRRVGVTDRPHDDDEDEDLDEAELLLAEIEQFASHRPRPLAKRNDPCPCGSGRKYKACHLGREQHPLDARAGWLYDKALRFLRHHYPDEAVELAHVMAEAMEDPTSYGRLRHLPFVADLALHEGELFDAFLASRNGLLPDDEALLATQWALVDRGVFEVERDNGDGRLELRDIGRGERITVVNVERAETSVRGRVMIGRPLPVGDTYRAFSGFMEVPRAVVNDLQAAIDDRDGYALAERLSQTRRPPRMSNTDGEDLVFHTLRWRITDPAAVDGALRAAGLSSDDDKQEWRLARDSKNMVNTTIAVLRLEGDVLIADVNSDERAEEVRALVTDGLPDAELLEDDAREFGAALENFDPDSVSPPLDQNDPAIRAVLEQFVLEQEQRWLDESIPALEGRTPREAAADPIGREQLIQLLDSFPGPTPDNPGPFDPERLRRALGL
jgi:SEC-C motif